MYGGHTPPVALARFINTPVVVITVTSMTAATTANPTLIASPEMIWAINDGSKNSRMVLHTNMPSRVLVFMFFDNKQTTQIGRIDN